MQLITFLFLDVTVYVQGKDWLINWFNTGFFAAVLELAFSLLHLYCNNGTIWFVWNFSNFLKLPNGSHLQSSKLKFFVVNSGCVEK